MPVTFILPDGIQYVGAAFVASIWVISWQIDLVAKSRRKAKIAYPQMYAEKAEAATSKDALEFNCCQRAHQNTLENLPLVVLSTVVVAAKYPVVAAALYGTWTAIRIPFTIGYRTGDPSKRNFLKAATMSFVLSITLLGTATYTVVKSFVA